MGSLTETYNYSTQSQNLESRGGGGGGEMVSENLCLAGKMFGGQSKRKKKHLTSIYTVSQVLPCYYM